LDVCCGRGFDRDPQIWLSIRIPSRCEVRPVGIMWNNDAGTGGEERGEVGGYAVRGNEAREEEGEEEMFHRGYGGAGRYGMPWL